MLARRCGTQNSIRAVFDVNASTYLRLFCPVKRADQQNVLLNPTALCHPDAPMSRFLRRAARSLSSFLAFVNDVMGDGLRFLPLAIRSHSALSAEILFLQKQLAFYQERQVEPHRLDDCARFALRVKG
jgi:hypothetical protein